MIGSKEAQRENIRKYFKEKHPKYNPTFFIQGSWKMKNIIRTKDETCDLDDGIYFKDNPENATCTTLQSWVKEAVDATTEATPSHKKKCITVDYNDTLSNFQYARKDPRFREIVELIVHKADSNGYYIPESEWKAWKGWDFGQKKLPSAWLTFLVYRIIKRMKTKE